MNFLKIYFLLFAILVHFINVPTALSQALSQNLVTINYLKTETISETEFRKALQLMQERTGTAFSGENRKLLLESMINDAIIFQAAEKANIKVNDSEVIQKLKEVGQVPSHWSLTALREQYNSGPMAKQQSWEEMIDLFRREIIKQNYLKSQIKPREPSSAEINKAYLDHQNEFILPATVSVSHVFFDIQEINNEEKRKKQDLAKEVYQKIIDSSITFEQAVRMHSEDSDSKGQLGYIGPVSDRPEIRESLGDSFVDSILSLQPGQISRVVTSKQGYHIIKAIDREKERLLKLEDQNPFNEEMTIRQLVSQSLQVHYFGEDVDAFVKTMREQATVNINQSMWEGWEQGSKNP